MKNLFWIVVWWGIPATLFGWAIAFVPGMELTHGDTGVQAGYWESMAFAFTIIPCAWLFLFTLIFCAMAPAMVSGIARGGGS